MQTFPDSREVTFGAPSSSENKFRRFIKTSAEDDRSCETRAETLFFIGEDYGEISLSFKTVFI